MLVRLHALASRSGIADGGIYLNAARNFHFLDASCRIRERIRQNKRALTLPGGEKYFVEKVLKPHFSIGAGF